MVNPKRINRLIEALDQNIPFKILTTGPSDTWWKMKNARQVRARGQRSHRRKALKTTQLLKVDQYSCHPSGLNQFVIKAIQIY